MAGYLPVHDDERRVHPGALEPGTEVGSWRVVEALGSGGYGAVYRVEDRLRPGSFYALKLALRHADARAEREVQLLMSRAVHPHVVRLHACGRWPHPEHGHLYFVMDWVPGLALHSWAETLNPSFRQLAEKVGKVALALGALHDKGVLHRDVKPEHILVRQADGEPILLDFGLGHYAGADTLTSTVLPPATPHLLSPEAVHFLRQHFQRPTARYEARPADDLHALGVTLYRVLTGHWPYSPTLPLDMLHGAIEGLMPPAPSDFNPRVPRALSDVVLRLLAKRPHERLQTGQQVHAALLAAVAFETPHVWDSALFEWEVPPEAEPGTPPRRIRRPEWPTEPAMAPPRKRGGRPLPLLSRHSRGEASPKASAPGQGGEPSRSRGRAGDRLAVLGAVLALCAWGLASMARLPTGSPGKELAREVMSDDSVFTAAPPPAAPTPAVVAVAATPPKDEAPVKQKTTASPSIPATSNKPPGLGALARSACTGAMAATLACSGAQPQVRHEAVKQARYNPGPCPEGSMALLEKLRGDGYNMYRFDMNTKSPTDLVEVREGPVSIDYYNNRWTGLNVFKLPQKSTMHGVLTFVGDRVYGRITHAVTPTGAHIAPLCLDIVEDIGTPGIPSMPGKAPDTRTVMVHIGLQPGYALKYE